MYKNTWEYLNTNCVLQKSIDNHKIKTFFNSYDKENKLISFSYKQNLNSPLLSIIPNFKSPLFGIKDLIETKNIVFDNKLKKLTINKKLNVSLYKNEVLASKFEIKDYFEKEWFLKRKKYFFHVAKQINFKPWKQIIFKRLQNELFSSVLEKKVLYFAPYYSYNSNLFLNLLKKYENIILANKKEKINILFLINYYYNYHFTTNRNVYFSSYFIANPKRHLFLELKDTIPIHKNFFNYFSKKEEQKFMQEYLILKNSSIYNYKHFFQKK